MALDGREEELATLPPGGREIEIPYFKSEKKEKLHLTTGKPPLRWAGKWVGGGVPFVRETGAPLEMGRLFPFSRKETILEELFS